MRRTLQEVLYVAQRGRGIGSLTSVSVMWIEQHETNRTPTRQQGWTETDLRCVKRNSRPGGRLYL